MQMTIDQSTILLVAGLYFILTLGLGFWVARGERNRTDDYFLAGRRLPWYAISLSMTGSNIGTEHFVGMVGTAYAFGLAPATFEWGNFIPYSVLLWVFLPFFYRKKLYTIPEFLEKRYLPSTRNVFAIFTLFHMIFAVLTPALYAGGRVVYEMVEQRQMAAFNFEFVGCILLISVITAAYCIYGGLLSVVWTDVLQVVILVAGGVLLTILGMNDVGGLSEVINKNIEADPTRFKLIQASNHTISPWTGVATFWFTLSMWYVGTNQFYIQRCLGARSEWDAKMGVIGCGILKIFLPFIIVLPGLIAYVKFGPETLAEDAVYVTMINTFLNPLGKGILLAVLVAAIMSTVSSVLNSASTIWSMDVHKRYVHREASEEELVYVGRWSTLGIIIIGTVVAPLLWWWEGGIFVYIQDMAAFFAPPISVVFLAAFLWRRAHGRAATFTLVFGIVMGLAVKLIAELWGEDGIDSLKPLLNRAALTWFFCLGALIATTYLLPRNSHESYDPDAIWNRNWARLPDPERALNAGPRNLMFWWIVMVGSCTALFVIFG